ncbi:MAG: cytidylate kinase-like family protein [Clostridiales bacterium]|nr:cytidylate kinase-like family protein [Clostridiales bacterium]
MKKIITISRELGSGGRTVGKLVANRRGIPYYDRELIDEAAKVSGLSPKYVETYEQKATSSLLYNLVMGSSYGYGILQGANRQTLPMTEQIYAAQQEVIRKYANSGSCVIVGRCADHILRDRNDVLRVFIYADMEKRIEHSVKEYGMSKDTAREEIERSDRERARHYSTFTDRKWGDRHNYDIMLNSGEIGLDNCAKVICAMTEMDS